MRKLLLAALCLAASPAWAQDPPAPLARALAEIEAHRVGMRVGCSIPVPALWNAPPWEQRAAAARRQAFEDCLEGVMRREQDRLAQLQERIGALRAEAADADWSAADSALDAKWSELDRLAGKLRNRDNWANTAVQILDTFTGPGAVFDTSPRQPWNRCAPYRCDSSVSAPGIR
ncbi:MAG TPA: hypothetical protein VEA60_12390 [Allosphingosinicella sp.]|nr:hypothetical protein [Allosphingosinicella sp.]